MSDLCSVLDIFLWKENLQHGQIFLIFFFFETNKEYFSAAALGSFECQVPLKASEAVQNSAKKKHSEELSVLL